MGCDYYIVKLLHIYFNDNSYADIEINRQKGYYYYLDDEDDENYEENVNEYKQFVLTPKMKPIDIYTDHTFHTSLLETKYKQLIEDEIRLHNKKWCDITTIVKVEDRFERE